MTKIFLSKYCCNIDKKSRVSVPASYRSILACDQNFSSVILYPSIRNQCIEGCSISRIFELSEIIQNLDPYSDERDAFETVILGESIELCFDSEGRIILPKNLIEYAKINDQVHFVGKGLVFEIWNPSLFEEYLVNAKSIAQVNRNLLKNV